MVGSLHASAEPIMVEREDNSYKTCLHVWDHRVGEYKDGMPIDERKQGCAEANLADFFKDNVKNIQQLVDMGAFNNPEDPKLNYGKVDELLGKIWNSKCRIAVHFSMKPIQFERDLDGYTRIAQRADYKTVYDRAINADDVRNKLAWLRALINITPEFEESQY